MGSKIERLTPEQGAALLQWRDRYLRHGISCEPADRPRAEAAIAAAYRRVGREPVPVIWVDSPLTASLLLHVFEQLALPESSLGSSLESSLGSSLRSSLWSSLGSSLWSLLESSLWSSLESSLGSSLWSSEIQPQYTYWWGSMDLSWIAFYRFIGEILGVAYSPDAHDGLRLMDEIGQSCGWWYPRDGLCVACERPEAVRMEPTGQNAAHRLHSADGPAVRFRDGWGIYVWHGVTLPPQIGEKLIERPDEIARDDVLKETNAEVRRVMMERLGSDRFAEMLELVEIHREEYGHPEMRQTAILLRTKEPDPVAGEHIQFVRVVCPSTGRVYHLCVPPTITTALEGVGWTFGKTRDEYAPAIEA